MILTWQINVHIFEQSMLVLTFTILLVFKNDWDGESLRRKYDVLLQYELLVFKRRSLFPSICRGDTFLRNKLTLSTNVKEVRFFYFSTSRQMRNNAYEGKEIINVQAIAT